MKVYGIQNDWDAGTTIHELDGTESETHLRAWYDDDEFYVKHKPVKKLVDALNQFFKGKKYYFDPDMVEVIMALVDMDAIDAPDGIRKALSTLKGEIHETDCTGSTQPTT